MSKQPPLTSSFYHLSVVMQLIKIIDYINIKYGTWLFYVALSLMLLSFYWIWTNDIPASIRHLGYLLKHVSQFLFALRIALQIHRHPRFVLLCCIIIPILYLPIVFGGEQVLFNSGLAIAASRDSKFRITTRIFLVTYLAILIIAPILWHYGFACDIVKHKYGLVGHSWGFTNPNRYGCFLQVVLFLLLFKSKLSQVRHIAISCIIGAIIIGFITVSTTSVMILLLLPIIYYAVNKYRIKPEWYMFLPVIGIVVSIALAIYYGPSTGETTFESRFSIPYLIFRDHGLSWVGQDCNLVYWKEAFRTGQDAIYLNNMFLSFFLRDGIIPGLIALCFYTFYLYRIAQKSSPLIISFTLCFFLLAFSQEYTLNVMLSFPLFLFYTHEYEDC